MIFSIIAYMSSVLALIMVACVIVGSRHDPRE